MAKPYDVTACLVTRGDQPDMMARIRESLIFDNVVVWDNSKLPDWKCAGRYMKIGVTRRSVYVAPKQRETRIKTRKRPKFADLLADRAMQPALDRNILKVQANVDDALQTVGRKWEQA